jgi:hypothetical protein
MQTESERPTYKVVKRFEDNFGSGVLETVDFTGGKGKCSVIYELCCYNLLHQSFILIVVIV